MDYTHKRYLIYNSTTGDKKTVIHKIGTPYTPPIGYTLLSVLGGMNLSEQSKTA